MKTHRYIAFTIHHKNQQRHPIDMPLWTPIDIPLTTIKTSTKTSIKKHFYHLIFTMIYHQKPWINHHQKPAIFTAAIFKPVHFHHPIDLIQVPRSTRPWARPWPWSWSTASWAPPRWSRSAKAGPQGRRRGPSGDLGHELRMILSGYEMEII